MSAPRLLFLYPPLWKFISASESRTVPQALSLAKQPTRCRRFHSITNHRQETFPQRYGPAAELLPPTTSTSTSTNTASSAEAIDREIGTAKINSGKGSRFLAGENKEAAKESPGTKEGSDPASGTQELENGKTPSELDAEALRTKGVAQDAGQDRTNKPLEKVLHMEPSTSVALGEHKTPQLHAPPYVHHFDTYGLVKDLEVGGFTQDQSITLMKAVRGLLATNLDVAKEGLVSKSDIENETYLFRAACSELRTEVQNTRKASSEKMRTERAHLQHEVDILNQKLTQESMTLKDDLKGMFNDRKMAVRMEQRGMESAIQELNYKITVALNSDSKGEVEGLRWVLTRRAAMAIGAMAFLILCSLRYSTYMIHLQAAERKRMGTNTGSSTEGTGGGSFTVPSREVGTQTGEVNVMMASMDAGTSPAYVSLG